MRVMPVQDGKNPLALLDRVVVLTVSMTGMAIVEAMTPKTTTIRELKKSIQSLNQPGWNESKANSWQLCIH